MIDDVLELRSRGSTAGRDRDALVERRRAREHLGADLVVVLREARRPARSGASLLEVARSPARRPSSARRPRAAGARSPRVSFSFSRLRVEEPVRPVRRVAERARDAVGGDLERPQHRRAEALSTGSSALERKETVSSTSESNDQPDRRRTGASRGSNGSRRGPEAAARWTDEPRTATRAFRLRGTSRTSLAGSPLRRFSYG